MPELPFERLAEIYRNTAFDDDGEHATLTIATSEILQDLQTIDHDEDAGRAANITVVDDRLIDRTVGETVPILVRAPSLRSGILARDVDTLLRSPRAFIQEPRAFFIVAGAVTQTSSPAPAVLTAYRQVLALVGLFAKAAAFLDPVRQELVFVQDGKVPVPVRYDAATLQTMNAAAASALIRLFSDDIHEDQRLSILAATIATTCSAQPTARRFRFILENLDRIVDEVRDGYRLFASEFTYAKIRRDVETAQFDYLGKIHKTFTDIQGQLLGIPIATVIVSSQLKMTSTCGLDFWTDIAVVAGAWLFVMLVLVAIANQWLTLNSIKDEVDHQEQKLHGDYAPIAGKFTDVFKSLGDRIRLHRRGLCVVAAAALGGAVLATVATWRVVDVNVESCVTGRQTTISSSPGPVASPPIAPVQHHSKSTQTP